MAHGASPMRIALTNIMQTEALGATCGATIDLFLYHRIGMFQIGVVSSALVQKNGGHEAQTSLIHKGDL